jgi:dihydrolipoamide dehydrogenase
MPKYDYNVIVIGGGSAGLVSSYIAAASKAKVALIEKHKMGGDCLNTGCVPSKAIIRAAKIMSYAQRAEEFGFKNVKIDFDFKDVMQKVHDVIKNIEPHDSVERYRSLGVDCITGDAVLTSPRTVKVGDKTYSARAIIVATGASPFVPAIEGIDKIDYLTSNNIWDLKELPKKLLVLGGGAIGCEMAQAFARFGSGVTIVEASPAILNREDAEVQELITKKFAKEGIKVLTNHKAKAFHENKLICDNLGREEEIEFDKILIASGRKPNVKGFGLEGLGVKIRDNGTILADNFMQTNIRSIYVCGDVTGPYQFTHTAAYQAWYAAVNALLTPAKLLKADYKAIGFATFTDPEIARVGLNEKEAKEKRVSYRVATYGIDDLDRVIIDREAHGFVKVLTAKRTDKILGVTIVGSHAGDLIAEYTLAMKCDIGLNKILGTTHIYPTLAEANKYAAGVWKKQSISNFVLKMAEKFHQLRRGE